MSKCLLNDTNLKSIVILCLKYLFSTTSYINYKSQLYIGVVNYQHWWCYRRCLASEWVHFSCINYLFIHMHQGLFSLYGSCCVVIAEAAKIKLGVDWASNWKLWEQSMEKKSRIFLSSQVTDQNLWVHHLESKNWTS